MGIIRLLVYSGFEMFFVLLPSTIAIYLVRVSDEGSGFGSFRIQGSGLLRLSVHHSGDYKIAAPASPAPQPKAVSCVKPESMLENYPTP